MGRIILEEEVVTHTPNTDKVFLYPKAGGELYRKNDSDDETRLAIMDSLLENSSHDYAAAHADWTLSTSEGKTTILELTNADAAVNIVAPDTQNKIYIVYNNCGFNAIIKISGGTGITIATGKTALVRHDGTDYVRVTSDV